MTKERENVSVEEYFEKVREGDISVLVRKEGEITEKDKMEFKFWGMLIDLHQAKETLKEWEEKVAELKKQVVEKDDACVEFNEVMKGKFGKYYYKT